MDLLFESCLRTVYPDQVATQAGLDLFIWFCLLVFRVVCSCDGEPREFYSAIWFSVACAQIFVNKMQAAWAQKLKELAVSSGRLLACCRYLEVIHCMQLLCSFLWVSEHTFQQMTYP